MSKIDANTSSSEGAAHSLDGGCVVLMKRYFNPLVDNDHLVFLLVVLAQLG